MHNAIIIDGSRGEGGGQILRASLALAMALGIPFRMVNIRANRHRAGLRPQHLACVRAAQELCGAIVQGDTPDSQEIAFQPGNVKGAEYHFDIGTGSSATLLLQTVIPPLLVASAPSTVTVTGGTHVPLAPPLDSCGIAFFPALRRWDRG